MTGIIVLWRESDASGVDEIGHRDLKIDPAPLRHAVFNDVDVYSEPVVVSALTRRGREWTASEIFLIEDLLLLKGAIATAVVEFDGEGELGSYSSLHIPKQSILYHWAKRVVQSRQAGDGHLLCGWKTSTSKSTL